VILLNTLHFETLELSLYIQTNYYKIFFRLHDEMKSENIFLELLLECLLILNLHLGNHSVLIDEVVMMIIAAVALQLLTSLRVREFAWVLSGRRGTRTIWLVVCQDLQKASSSSFLQKMFCKQMG